MKKNRYVLDAKVKEKYEKIVKGFINGIETENPLLEKMDLSDTELNPHTLMLLLEDLGYEETDRDGNGWQIDYWITMKKEGKKTLLVKGTIMTFELILSLEGCD